MRDFTVRPVLNGYIVECDCQTLVFASDEALKEAISRYLTYPEETEKYFLRQSLHSNCGYKTECEAPGIRENVVTPELFEQMTRG